jgi:hypothetical protein
MRAHALVRKPGARSGAPAARQVALGPRVRCQTAEIRHFLGRGTVQPKLEIGASNDAYEREADRVADQVMRMPAPDAGTAVPTHRSPPAVQRVCDECAEELQAKPADESVQRQAEDEEELLQTKSADASQPKRKSGAERTTSAPVDAAVSRGTKGGGHPLPVELRSFFEPRFGRDFSQVRMHTGPEAADSAQEIRARAYTVGRDVVFGPGEYAPDSNRGRWLVAHELAHVVQQGGGSDRSGILRRQPVVPAVPAYRDCTAGITGVADPNERLENARLRAREYVGAAIRALGAAPVAGSTYATALNRHFINPTAAQRATILANFEQIRGTLRVGNYICNSNNICGTEQAFWIQADDLVHVCPPFWGLDRTCSAIVLIHEGGHDIGVDAAVAGHPPNRGDPAYPTGNTAPPVGQTTAQRIQNPDAYAFFAAHLWRSTDTSRTCF